MMKKKVYSLIAVLAATACFCCAPVTGHAATPNPFFENQTYNFYNMSEQANTQWLEKINPSDVYVNPLSGPALYYTVQGKNTDYPDNAVNRSERIRITNGAQAGVPNTFNIYNEQEVRLHMERTTSGQVYTSGVWNPYTI